MPTALPSRYRTVALLAAILTAGVFIRCRFIDDVFLEGHVLPYDPDSSYHLWRIEDAVRHGGRPPRFDSYVNAPEGARVILPDGFDGALAVPVLLASGRDASRWEIQVASLIALPILGALALLALYLLARRAYGTAAAVCATALGAMLPSHVEASFLGRVDHHVLEIALPAVALAVALGAGEKPARRLPRAAGVAVALAVLGYGVPVAVLHVAAVAFAVAVAALRATRLHDTRAAGDMLQVTALGMVGAAALLLPDALGRQGFAYYQPSWIGPSALVGAGVGAAALALAARRGFRTLLGAMVALAALSAVAAAILFRDAAGYLGRQGLLSLITEAQPLWSNAWDAIQVHSAVLPLVPVLLIAYAWRGSPAAAGVAAFGVLGFALACLQQRFSFFLAVPAAAVMGATIAMTWGRTRWLGRALLLIVTAAVLAPSVRWLIEARLLGIRELALLDAGNWLAANTPAPTASRSSRQAAEWTVLTMWGDGSHVAYLSDRPVVVAELFHGDYGRGLEDAVQSLYGDDPEPIIERRRVRYVVLVAQDPSVEQMHRRILGLGPPTNPPLFPHLYDFDGGSVAIQTDEGARVVPARGDLRLVHEAGFSSRRGDATVPAAKLFERVAGATVTGICHGADVRARVPVVTDAGRAFDFVSAVPCVNGAFALRVPYAGIVEISRGDPAMVLVTDHEVVAGREIRVP